MSWIFGLPLFNQVIGYISILRGSNKYPDYLELAGTSNGDTILDVGSGYGAIFFSAGEYSDLRLIALNPNLIMTYYATGSKNAFDYVPDGNHRQVLRCPAEQIKLDSESIDTVIASWCLDYVDTQRAIQEIHRVLKPQGVLVATPFTDKILNYAGDVFHPLEYSLKEEVALITK